MKTKGKPMPTHFWKIHKKVYNREFLDLTGGTRWEVHHNQEGEQAEAFFAYVYRQAEKLFEDEDYAPNSRYRFQYDS
jgi:hypothetical protein